MVIAQRFLAANVVRLPNKRPMPDITPRTVHKQLMIKEKRIRCSGSILFLENWENEEMHGFGSIHLESFCWSYLVNNETSDHTRVCGSLKACLLTHPTQAMTTAPGSWPVIAGSYPHDRAGFGLSSRKGPDLGGGKVVGVTETVAISGLISLFLQQKHKALRQWPNP